MSQKIEILSNCDLTFEVFIGDIRKTLTYAELTDLHSEIEKCLEWDKPHVAMSAEEFAAQLDDMLKGTKDELDNLVANGEVIKHPDGTYELNKEVDL